MMKELAASLAALLTAAGVVAAPVPDSSSVPTDNSSVSSSMLQPESVPTDFSESQSESVLTDSSESQSESVTDDSDITQSGSESLPTEEEDIAEDRSEESVWDEESSSMMTDEETQESDPREETLEEEMVSFAFPEEYAQALANEQADSMMGNLGLMRGESSGTAFAVFTIADYATSEDVDATYYGLWEAMYAQFEEIAAQGILRADCTCENGTITIWL